VHPEPPGAQPQDGPLVGTTSLPASSRPAASLKSVLLVVVLIAVTSVGALLASLALVRLLSPETAPSTDGSDLGQGMQTALLAVSLIASAVGLSGGLAFVARVAFIALQSAMRPLLTVLRSRHATGPKARVLEQRRARTPARCLAPHESEGRVGVDGGLPGVGRRTRMDLRVFIDGALMKSHVCRSGSEMVDRAAYWRAAFEVKKWV
jgi:hypothetical protein